LVGWQEGHPLCKKSEWWDAGMVMCLGQGADFRAATNILTKIRKFRDRAGQKGPKSDQKGT